MAILLGAILALVPLLITPNYQFFFDVTPKAAVLLAGASIAILLLLRADGGIRALSSCRFGRWFCALLLAGMAWAPVATLLSVDRPLSIAGTNWRRFGLPAQEALLVLALLTAGWMAGRPERIRPLLRTICAVGCLAALYGILQYFGWDPWLPRGAYRAGEGEFTIVRPPSTLGHAGYFATWLLFPIFASRALFFADKTRLWRMIAAASASAGSLAILLSGTRSALISLVFGAAILAWWMRAKPSRRLVFFSLAAAAALAIFYFSPPGAMLRSRVHWIGEDIRGGARLWLWRDTLRMGMRRPLTGYGPETFTEAFPRFESAALAKAYPDFYHESPHNAFLDALSQGGIPGLAILIGLPAAAFLAGLRAGDNLSKPLTVSLIAAGLSLQFTAPVIPIALYAMLIAAMLVALRAPAMERVSSSERRWPIQLVCIGAAIVLAAFAVRWWVADAMLGRAARALDRRDVRAAASEFRSAAAWGANADLWYSRRMLLAAQSGPDPAARLIAWQQALAAAIRAASRAEDRQNARYNLAAFYATLNDFRRTEENLRAAIAEAPVWYKAHWMLARVLVAQGRLPEAEEEARIAADLNAGKDAEVRGTYDSIRAARKR